MLLDEETSSPARLPKDGRSPKRAIAAVSGILVVVLAVGAAVFTGKHINHQATVSNTSDSARAARLTQVKASTPPKSWTLKFDSTFSGNHLDSRVWATCYPWAPSGCTNFGNTKDQDEEWYEASQDQVSGGILDLVAQRVPTAGLDQQGSPKTYACRSGMVTTYPSLRFQYGYVQITAKVPFGKGLWPALWLAAANQKWPPEIDMLEHWASEPYGKIYLHSLTSARQGGEVKMPGLSTGWHTFSLSWTKTRLTWYYDGTQLATTSTGVPQQAMYLIANLAVDNASPGGCSGSMAIKSVKVWQPPS